MVNGVNQPERWVARAETQMSFWSTRKVTVLVPEDCAEGLRQFAHELCRRQQADTSHVACGWRKLSPTAELMVDPERGVRCAIRDTGADGPDRYHWTVTMLGEDLPLSAGRVMELVNARSAAEAALLAMADRHRH